MDDSFSKPNTTDQKQTFLQDAKHLHERREVHEKGVFHANYEGKGFFGSIGQFFKNIKLAFEKNDMDTLKSTLDKECDKYINAFNTTKLTMIKETKMKRLEQLQRDISFIVDHLWVMASQSSPKTQSGSEIQSGSEGYKILWSAVDKFKNLGEDIAKSI